MSDEPEDTPPLPRRRKDDAGGWLHTWWPILVTIGSVLLSIGGTYATVTFTIGDLAKDLNRVTAQVERIDTDGARWSHERRIERNAEMAALRRDITDITDARAADLAARAADTAERKELIQRQRNIELFLAGLVCKQSPKECPGAMALVRQ